MGSTEASIIKQCKNEKRELPQKILNKPQLLAGLEIFLEAFYELDSDRNNGFSIGKIPFTSIMSYANEYEFEGEMRDDLFYFIRGIDNKIVKVINQRENQKRNVKKPT